MSNLGNYRIIRPLGGGTFGKVKLAEHRVTSSLVAIKILNKREIQEKKLSKKVRREIAMLSNFHHPNIIKLYDVIDSTTNLMLVMEFLPGGELYNVIERNGKLSEDKARVFFKQILCGLEYIHMQGYAHRDLKPENILLDKEGNIKIGDFGLSNILPIGDYLRTSCGSPNYAAPEVISGNKYCGNEVDVWSLGVILFSLVSGHLPFDESTIPALFAKIKSAKFEIPYYFSEPLRDLVYRLLNNDPISRITSKQIWKHPWVNIQIPNEIPIKRIFKELYKKEINFKVLKDTLTYEEFENINIEKNVIDVIEGKAKDEYGIMPVYKIVLDIDLAKKRKEIVSSFPFNYRLKLKNFEHLAVEESTKASSYMDVDSETSIPNNWVYGFRCSLQPYYFTVKLVECFNSTQLKVKKIANFRMLVKKMKSLKFEVSIFKEGETFIIDCKLIKGCVMEFSDILFELYSCLYKNIHF